jgi:hypothetical protein
MLDALSKVNRGSSLTDQLTNKPASVTFVHHVTWSERLEPVIIAAFFVPALLLGGAGASYPLVALSIELLATAALAFLLSTGRPWQRLARAPAALVLVGVVAAFPLVQLIPLPPSIWSNLPGRDV